ncbi:hypothetical protein HAX54_009650 [Datura stramonium]|uniref:Uncharacterized protein n=1 Tax=Datura stramonium TaxID=4076 RepID=A0ABS8TGF5_DATST|nr:hypothetical protein [Datura stramonium]
MSLQIFHSSTPLHLPASSSRLLSRFVTSTSRVPNCSTRSPVGLSEVQSQFKPPTGNFRPIEIKPSSRSSDDTPENEGNEGISGIKVPRQRYIAASKSQLLNVITTTMFNSPDEAHQFRHVSL